jgi:hypothetical protein
MRFPKLRTWNSARPASEAKFPLTSVPTLRTALLGHPSCLTEVAPFEEDRWREIPSYAPQVLIGRPSDLVRVAEHIFRGVWDLSCVDSRVIALTLIGEAPLPDAQRDLIWRAFRVPVYEALADQEAGILASECEAFEGWHVVHPKLRFDLQSGRIVFQRNGFAGSAVPTGLTADGLDGMCACGEDAPLLRKVRLAQVKQVKPFRTKVARA